MGLSTGSYAIGPATGALTVHTRRGGIGARVGHDLLIEVTRWGGTVRVDADRIGSSAVEVVVEAASLEVRAGTGAVPLLATNKSEITRTIRKVLATKEHPEIRFRSAAVVPAAHGFTVPGTLTIAGVDRPAELAVSVDLDGGAPRGSVTATVVQSAFGIKPYSAMFGALRVRDAVEVRAEIQLSPRR
jgi:polyisoprenoid-binding protein YceI